MTLIIIISLFRIILFFNISELSRKTNNCCKTKNLLGKAKRLHFQRVVVLSNHYKYFKCKKKFFLKYVESYEKVIILFKNLLHRSK